MNQSIQAEQWVWVVVQDPEGNEQFLGQHDQGTDVSYIPVFLERDDALMCMNLLAREKGHKYEAQAIMYEDLAGRAAKEGYVLFVLNHEGGIVEKIDPLRSS